MRRVAIVGVVGWLLSGGLGVVAHAQSETSKPAAEPPRAPSPQVSFVKTDKGAAPAPQDPAPLPVDLDRVHQEAERQPAVKLDDQQLRFYALVVAKAPKFNFNDFLGDYDLKNGPTKGGAAMTHQEFLGMVTPKALNELLGSTSGSSFAMFQAALMNAAGQALIRKGLERLHDARTQGEIRAIREQIDRELAALMGKDK